MLNYYNHRSQKKGSVNEDGENDKEGDKEGNVNEDGDNDKEGSVNEDGDNDKEGLGKGIQFITIQVRIILPDQIWPNISINISSEDSVENLKKLVIHQKKI